MTLHIRGYDKVVGSIQFLFFFIEEVSNVKKFMEFNIFTNQSTTILYYILIFKKYKHLEIQNYS